jgi:hypothetical protein
VPALKSKGSETAKALQNLHDQLRLIDKSIRLIEQVERIREKRRRLLPEQAFVACCMASTKINPRRSSCSRHDSRR